MIANPPGDNDKLGTEIVMRLKYLSNFGDLSICLSLAAK